MPFYKNYKKNKKKISSDEVVSNDTDVRRATGSSSRAVTPAESGLRSKSDGRRISDRLKPLLAKVVSVVSSDSVSDAFFNMTDDMKHFFECEMLVIYSVNSDRTQLYSRNHISDEFIEKRIEACKSSLPGYVFEEGVSLNIADVYDKKELSQYPGLVHDSSWDGKIGIKSRSIMAIPIFCKSKTIGVLEIVNKLDLAPFSMQFLNLAKNLSKSLGSALEKLSHEEGKETLQAIGLAVQEATTMEDILFDTTRLMLDLFDADVVNIFAVDKKRNEIYSKAKTPFGVRERRVSIGLQSIIGWVALEKRMVNISDIHFPGALSKYHPYLAYDDVWDKKMCIETKAMLCCPMIYENKLMGILQVINTRIAEPFDSNHEKNIITVSQMLAIAFYNNSKFAQTKLHKFSYLINEEILSPSELEFSLVKARNDRVDPEDLLLNERGIKRSDLGKSLEYYYGIPYLGYNDSIVPPDSFFDGLNKKHLIRNHWAPVHNDDNLVVVLLDDPSNMDKVRSIKMVFPKKEIQFKVGLKADIVDYLVGTPNEESQRPRENRNVSSLLESLIIENQDEILGTLIDDTNDNIVEIEDSEDDDFSGRDTAIVGLVNRIITNAYDKGISDIHVEPGIGSEDMLIRYRKEGE